jgi:hypothetical protein
MKRILFVSVLVAALAVPSAAISSTQGFSHSAEAKRGDDDFRLFFRVVTKNGHPKLVKNFEYRRVDLTCETGGPLVVKGSGFGTAQSGPNGPARVQNGEFSKRYVSEAEGGGEGSFKITGKFKNHNTEIRGTINVKGDFDSVPASGCKSGDIKYFAA